LQFHGQEELKEVVVASETGAGWVPEQSGRMTVKVRAVIVDDGRLVVVPERRLGEHSHFALPGGRIGRWEGLTAALVREVHEETGLEVVVGDLLYIAEMTPPRGNQDLNLIFRAQPIGGPDFTNVAFIDLAENEHPKVLPPIVDVIAADRRRGWQSTPRWLGNVWTAH
jgi:8-oxo-dGTP diphosphatase